MRGKAVCTTSHRQNVGITPAYAGKSFAKTIRVPQSRDHPRLCGEKETIKVGQVTGTGSPPPMRGKDAPFRAFGIKLRITPAYAGKRIVYESKTDLFEDHPRLCGEKTATKDKVVAFLGSPPPMRGKASDKPFLQRRCRITPAYAGKSR